MLYFILLLIAVLVFIICYNKPIYVLFLLIIVLQFEYYAHDVLSEGLTLGRLVGGIAIVIMTLHYGHGFKSRLLRDSYYVFYFCLFIVVVLFSSYLGGGDSLSQGIRLLMLVIFSILIVDSVNNLKDIEVIASVIAASSLIGGIFSLFQYYGYTSGSEVMGTVLESREGVRYAGLNENPNSLAINIITGMPFLFLLVNTIKTKKLKLIYYLLIFVGILSLVITVSRSGLYILLVYVIVYMYLRRKVFGGGLIKNMLYLMFAVYVLYIMFMSSEYVITRLMRPIIDYEADTSLDTRLNILMEGVNVMKNNVFFGVGLQNTYLYSNISMRSHDTISSLLGETGVLGFILFVIFNSYLVARIISLYSSLYKENNVFIKELVVMLFSVFIILIVWIPVKVIFFQRIYWIWVGLVLWLFYREHNKNSIVMKN